MKVYFIMYVCMPIVADTLIESTILFHKSSITPLLNKFKLDIIHNPSIV